MCRMDIVELQALMVQYVMQAVKQRAINERKGTSVAQFKSLTLYMFAASKKKTHSMIHISLDSGEYTSQ